MRTLESRRLKLRPWTGADRDAWHALASDRDVAHWLGGVAEAALLDERLAAAASRAGDSPWGVWALDVPGEGAVGAAGFAAIRTGLPLAGVEAQWRIRSPFQGLGLMREAMDMLLEEANRARWFEELWTFTAQTNLRSQALMHRLGFSPVPERDFDHPSFPAGHRLCRHVVYRRRFLYTATA